MKYFHSLVALPCCSRTALKQLTGIHQWLPRVTKGISSVRNFYQIAMAATRRLHKVFIIHTCIQQLFLNNFFTQELEDMRKSGLKSFRDIQVDEQNILTWHGLIVPVSI